MLISFDGLDSTGKATQTKRAVARLKQAGHTVLEFSTPDYTTPLGQELKLRLQGKLGDWKHTPWQEKLRYFAHNRAEHRDAVVAALEAGCIIVYDRYVPSSLAFITVEALPAQEVDLFRKDIYQAIEREEYEIHNMPKEDVSVFLDVPPDIASKLLDYRKKHNQDEDEYTDHLHVQERLYNEYDIMCRQQPERFCRIHCREDGHILGIDEIAEHVWQSLLTRFPKLARK